MKKEEFIKAMTPILDLFPPPTTWKAGTFHALVDHLSLSEFTEACTWVAQTFKPTYNCPFPVPKDILEAVKEINASTPRSTIDNEEIQAQEADKIYALIWKYMSSLPIDEKRQVGEVAKKRLEHLENCGLLSRYLPNITAKLKRSAFIHAFCEQRRIDLENTTEVEIRRILWPEEDSDIH